MSNKKYILGDCMTYLKEYKDNHFDLAIVDPPYGIGQHKAAGKRANSWQAYTKDTKNWDNKPPPKEYFKQLFRVSKNQIIWGSNYFVNHLPISSNWIVWNKLQPIGLSFAMHELAFCSIKMQARIYTKSIFKNRATTKHSAKKYERIHPTQKPVALYRWLLQNYAKKNDLILDTHVGSASSLIACEIEGFDYVGFEKDKDYYRDSNKRIKQHLSQITMF